MAFLFPWYCLRAPPGRRPVGGAFDQFCRPDFLHSGRVGTVHQTQQHLHHARRGTLDRLRELNPRSRFEPRRFRPNLIIDTGDGKGFVENDWIGKVIAIGPEVRIQVTGPCPRCVMTTLAQADLPKDTEILKTAVHQNKGQVGAYASVVQTGTIRVGDTITVV